MTCPVCHGAGGWDESAADALLEEHLTSEQLALAKAAAAEAGYEWGGWLACDECEGTGVVTDERAKDLMAGARAAVDQIIARVAHEDSL